jgi:hypothetical protein
MDQVWQRAKRLRPLHTECRTQSAVAGLGEYYKRAHVRKFFQSLDSWEVRGVRWKVAADPNYRFSVTAMGPIPHDSAPNPLAKFW